MPQNQSQIYTQQESDLVRTLHLITRNYKLLLISVLIALFIAFLYNRIAKPVYKITASLLILEENNTQIGIGNTNEYINNSLFGNNQGFQNELYVLQSTPLIEQTVKNLDLTICYFKKDGFRHIEVYKNIPFRILLLPDHVQPLNIQFFVALHGDNKYSVTAKAKEASFGNLYSGANTYIKNNWNFEHSGKFGDLIETPDLAFMIERDSAINYGVKDEFVYSFEFSSVSEVTSKLKSNLDFFVPEREATIIEIGYKSASSQKGIDLVNELMNVYSTQNINQKNHIADVTISYIEQQLGEISDSLNQTEDNLQFFRSSRQLLNVDDQASNISEQYMTLQNQLAELVTRKRYYNYLAEYLSGSKEISNIIVPTSMGVEDELLNSMVSELIAAQSQRSNLIRNRQEKNPMVQRLEIQIENTKKTIFENITAVQKTTDIAIDELNKRINRTKAEISSIPKTQRQLGGIERKYRLNDAIYNYLLEKRAEAKISQASNLPDNVIIEPANLIGIISPYPIKNYIFAIALGLLLPFTFFFLKGMLNEKIEFQERIDQLTDAPLLGKIPYNRKKINNVVFDYPKTTIAEAFRALRTNIEYRFKEISQKVIIVSSSIEGEGKSFTAMNLAMSYAQLGRKTLLIDFDLRKPTGYFSDKMISPLGLSSYFIDNVKLDEIIIQSPHKKLLYIPSGPIPPNPVEMLATESIKELLDNLKERFDCIVIDSAPLAQVADAYLLIDYANIKIIIARYNYTLKKVFRLIMDDLKQKNIDNLCVVLNDNRVYRDQYGYGYGYDNKKNK